MPLSLYAYDTFVAQEFSKITECRAKPIAPDFPDHNDWLGNFVLNTIFRTPLPKDKAALAFALIRRAESAIDDYEEARRYLELLVAKRDISLYFRCLRRFESTVAMVYQSLDFIRKALCVTLFKPGDGSPYERINKIYNNSRHSNPEDLPGDQLHAVWIKNEGLFTEGAELTFEELRQLVFEIASIAGKTARGELPPQQPATT